MIELSHILVLSQGDFVRRRVCALVECGDRRTGPEPAFSGRDRARG